jgi:hypothetical protein
MFLTKDGITIEVSHPSDIARYKQIGYVQVKDNPNVAEVKSEEVAPEEVVPELAQQEKDQKTIEETLQPAKKGKGKS